MPKKGSRGIGGMVELCPFRVLANTGMGTGADTLTIMEYDLVLSNLGVRAAQIGACFEYFRFKRLRAYQYTDAISGQVFTANISTRCGDHFLAFVESNAALTGTATTLAQLTQYELFRAGSMFSRLDIDVPQKLLRENAYKWFNTASTGAATDDLSPGIFIAATHNTEAQTAGATPVARLVIEGVIEFSGRITPALAFGAPVKPLAEKKDEFDDDDLSVLSCVARSYPNGKGAFGVSTVSGPELDAIAQRVIELQALSKRQ